MTPEDLATLAREAVDTGDVCDLDDCPTCGPTQERP